MLYSEIIAVCSQIHTKHINTLCGQNVEFVNIKLVVNIVTAGLYRVNCFLLVVVVISSWTADQHAVQPISILYLSHHSCKDTRFTHCMYQIPSWEADGHTTDCQTRSHTAGTYFLTITCHMPKLPLFPWGKSPNNVWWVTETIQLLVS